MYDYDYYATKLGLTDEVLATLANIGMVALVVYVILSIFMIISYWLIFKKAGQHGFAAIIPIYNMVVKFRVAKLSPWLILLYIIPIVNFIAILVLGVLLSVNTAKAFGKRGGYCVGLFFLPIIFYPILAFGKAQYQEE